MKTGLRPSINFGFAAKLDDQVTPAVDRIFASLQNVAMSALRPYPGDHWEPLEVRFGVERNQAASSICVVDGDGEIVCEGTVLSEPEAIAEFIKTKAPHSKRIGLETGPTSTWLWHELRALGLPVICIDARHAKAALSMQINKIP